jgi:hypothetical protein
MKGRLLGETALAAFAPAAKPREPLSIWRFYQQGVFQAFHNEMEDEIERVYIGTPRVFRQENLSRFLGSEEHVFGQDAWDACRSYLDCTEEAIAKIIARRTAPEWLHLYRRLGVSLHPALGGKTDEVTNLLVREIAELAMEKHGATRARSDLVPSGNLRPRQILGGLYIQEAVKRLGSRQAAEAEARDIIRSNQLVLLRFDYEDLFDLYRIEGLAYEYWRTTAALRSIGKGAGVRRDNAGFLDISLSSDLKWLIEKYDAMTARTRFSGSLIGSWFPNTIESDRPIQIVAANYNRQRTLGAQCDMFGIACDGPARMMVPNFELAPINLEAFQLGNQFAGGEFARRTGFTLLDLAYCLRTISTLVISPPDAQELRRRALPVSDDGPMFASILNVSQRGYGIFAGSSDRLADWAVAIANEAGFLLDRAAAVRCLEHMTLTVDSRQFIGLWSRGRRFPLIPIRGGFMIDLEAIGGFLLTLFVRVPDPEGQRGSTFEAVWRLALGENDFDLAVVGEIVAPNRKMREVDAGVRIGSTLFLMECRSIERPLDYEIGKPAVIASRQADLFRKLEQVESLRDFLIAHPRGRNYDVSWATHIAHFVVGPFEEFVWSREPRFWDGDTPRILSADAMLAVLEQARAAR